MAAQFVTIDRETTMLLPPDLCEWVPEDSMVHFIIDAVESLSRSITLCYVGEEVFVF